MEEYLSTFKKQPPATNVASLVAQGAVRINEMGFERDAASPKQTERMQAEIKKAMEAGCVGLSSGLVYMPGEFTSKDELADLCKAIVPYGGFYATHIRSEGEHVFNAVDEALYIAQKSGVPLHISHLKLASSSHWGETDKLLGKIDHARSKGFDVTFDAYPYALGCTSLAGKLPPWVFEGGTDRMLERLQSVTLRDRMRADLKNNDIHGWESFAYPKGCNGPTGWDSVIFANVMTEENQSLLGKTIEDVAKEQNKDPFDVMFDTIIQEKGRIQILRKIMNEDDVKVILSRPDCIIVSDGQSLSTEGVLSTGRPHPRAFGSRAKILGHYSRDLGLFSVETAVRKMTSLPAERMGLHHRGLLRVGNYADITIFDYNKVRDAATFIVPQQYSEGFSYVVVNGKVALRNGVETSEFSGRFVEREK